MGFAISKTRTTFGVQAVAVSVEVHISSGLPAFNLVGLPEAAVKESKDRVRSAIINSHFEFPLGRITVNLSPAHFPKAGSGFDLAIAIGILAASRQIPTKQLNHHEFIGELGLNGQIKSVHAIIPIIIAAKNEQQVLIIPSNNANEASIIDYSQLFLAETLNQICEYLCQNKALPCPNPYISTYNSTPTLLDWSDVKGQHHPKKALEIAACGGHSTLLYGPPGSGKTMLAKRFHTILPELSEQSALESAVLHSIYGQTPDKNTWRKPPFRTPHHTASYVALVGGGNPPKPGEISLAHKGVLFLDELPEFQRRALETLREPLESKTISISRATTKIEFPADFQLIAAMNPCPCGYHQQTNHACTCSLEQIKRYRSRISGPILDRIDLQVHVQPITQKELIQPNPNTVSSSAAIQNKIIEIRAIQLHRQNCLNAALSANQTEEVCQLSHHEQQLLEHILNKLKLSARGFHRLLKVARTIADMERSSKVTCSEIKQALSFRQSHDDIHNASL